MELLRTLVLVLWAFGTYFLFCECGEMVTKQFEKFNDVLDQCSWHLFSIELQQMFVVIVANSQQLAVIRGFGNLLCARRSFKAVSFVYVLRFFYEVFQRILFFIYVFPIDLDMSNGFLIFHDAPSNRWLRLQCSSLQLCIRSENIYFTILLIKNFYSKTNTSIFHYNNTLIHNYNGVYRFIIFMSYDNTTHEKCYKTDNTFFNGDVVIMRYQI